jgi:hypothetical protein
MFGMLVMCNYIACHFACIVISLYISFFKKNFMVFIRTDQAFYFFIIQMILYNIIIITILRNPFSLVKF